LKKGKRKRGGEENFKRRKRKDKRKVEIKRLENKGKKDA
jgi:hypothetical protein